MDVERFEQLCKNAQRDNGIGTLAEKTLHAVVKNYIEPNASLREVKIGRHVVDVANEQGIFEVQTQGFEKLKTKLTHFLPSSKVTVVYPVAALKWVRWINPATGEITNPRRSPKTGEFYDLLFEAYRIKQFLKNDNLHFKVLLLEIEEHKLQNGWGNGGKRGGAKLNKIPTQLLQEKDYTAKDFEQFLPEMLPSQFTAKDYAKAVKRTPNFGGRAVSVLCELGVITLVGKRGRAFLYEK